MANKRVEADEAARMVEQGWTFVDVRSVPEFADGHPAGAFNVPLLHKGPSGMTPNPDFERVMLARFARDTPIVLSCRSGGRSQRAADALLALGFAQIADVRGGWAGEVDALGQVVCAGWQARGLPTSNTPAPGRSWDELRREP
jgi:rhodanese-related sulfurtransferase